ncbi:chemotaxis protein CheB [Dactylosporangium sp. CS-033363]|uniref:chemotaxis protein CheB n=1 Tax=Dactylosporangium sp. CS-033363 TaxID=3239935 RepID=UPI003D9143F8
MPGRDVVVIGASAGGLGALRQLVAGLPAGLPASVLIVVHTRQSTTSRLPQILAGRSPLPAAHAVSGQALTRGVLTIAPPGHHLVVAGDDQLRLHRGPLVHHTRPAADPLLHSAAAVCGRRVIAVLLSGQLRDGAAGAAAVAAAGGTVLVQDPAEAPYPDMPRATLARVPGAATWPAEKLGPAIADLVASSAPARVAPPPFPPRVHGIDDALWLAVARLHAHAAAQHRLEEILDFDSPLIAEAQNRAADARRAAEIITTHVLPHYQRDTTDPQP